MPMERLDKILASQAVGSRSEVRALMKRGQVRVNGEVVIKPDRKADPEADKIVISGEPLLFKRHIYLMMNKPSGVVSASSDARMQTVIDLVPKELFRRGLFPAGRLDRDTEGLLIITDDGDFAHRMLSPKSGVSKLYEAQVSAPIGEREIALFRDGIRFRDGVTCLPAELTVLSPGETPKVQVRICEGKFHQIKKMFLAVGCEVLHLKRVKIGNLILDEKLGPGECREMSEEERCAIFYKQNL